MKLISVAALTVLAVAMMADTCQNTGTTVGNTANTGAQTASNLNPQFTYIGTTTSGYFGFGSAPFPTNPLAYNIQTNQSLQGALVNPGVTSTGFALLPIYGFSIQCIPYNSTLATTPPGPNYPYTVETNGIAGGTVTVTEYKLIGAGVNVGTVVLPTSPHGGPYVDMATSTLAAAYTPTAGSTFSAYITTNNATPTNGYTGCIVTTILQNPLAGKSNGAGS